MLVPLTNSTPAATLKRLDQPPPAIAVVLLPGALQLHAQPQRAAEGHCSSSSLTNLNPSQPSSSQGHCLQEAAAAQPPLPLLLPPLVPPPPLLSAQAAALPSGCCTAATATVRPCNRPSVVVVVMVVVLLLLLLLALGWYIRWLRAGLEVQEVGRSLPVGL